MTITDTLTDPRFAHHPLVRLYPNIRSYLGVPIFLSDGTFFGTLCGIDPEPRDFTRQQVELVIVLARLLATQIELHQRRELFNCFMDLGPLLASIKDDQGRYLYANAPFLQQSGRSKEGLLGKTARDWMPSEAAEIVRTHDREVLDTDRPVENIEAVPLHDGQTHYLLSIRFPFRNATGDLNVGGIAVDITEQRRAQLKAAELAAIVQSSQDAIIGMTLGGVITSWNLGAQRIFGYSAAEVTGQSIRILDPPGAESEIPVLLERLASGERIERYETQRRTKEGQIFDVALAFSSIHDPDGTVTGASTIVRDITERKRAQLQLATALEQQRASNEELTRINRMMGDFVSVVSHEFRTPLTSIQGFGELIRDEDLDPVDVKDYADEIFRSAQRLARLINDMLDLDRLESGRVEMRREPVDFNAIVRGAATPLVLTSEKHEIRLELEPGLPEIVGDRDRLTQVVTNLLSNAIKYSPAGGEITLTTASEGANVHVTVMDNGLGIPAEKLETIFERYSRVGSERNATIQGTGLGLPITRQIVELHGGRIWAEARPAGGSIFHALLPIGSADDDGA